MAYIFNKGKMRFYILTVLIVGIILVLNLGGVVTPVGGGLAKGLNLVDDSQNLTIQDVKSSNIWDSTNITSPGIKFILLGFLGASIVIGAFGRTPDIRYITAALVFTLGSLLLADMIFIFTLVVKFDGWMGSALGILIGGLIAGFMITLIQFWQGTD